VNKWGGGQENALANTHKISQLSINIEIASASAILQEEFHDADS
jgi:hypothetical protein